MSANEATARIKINKLLEAAGWRFFADANGPANVRLESNVTLTAAELDAMGVDFEKTTRGATDFILEDGHGFPLIVLEAKSEDKSPLVGKEQARKYARALPCRFVILSNGNLHYFWDLERGNPYLITSFPTPDSATGYKKVTPDPKRLVSEQVNEDYIALSQRPTYMNDAAWRNPDERQEYVRASRLRFLRHYQLRAVHALQRAVYEGKDRFLFEMATGTGKTLTAAAVIKLFLRSQNAHRVLFLVDRLELEDQAKKALVLLLANDYSTVIYKEKRDEWKNAEIVVSTVQSLQFDNKYQRLFSPTDFDLVISDEAHRSIGGNARAVFEYFVGYKLGLTATPRDYLKRFDTDQAAPNDQRAYERRLLLDTYRTFGCESGEPTFRYSLLDGVRDGYLVNPTVVDARSDITTELLSEQGYAVSITDNDGEEQEDTYSGSDFERRFFSEVTNQVLCKAFLDNALHDPVSGEVGKSIIFAVSQRHAAKLTQILNQMADRMYPGRYQSDFAVQVTSQVADAQQFSINFANNNLLGYGNFIPEYRTSKARVCVTVGMMTTGYDCTDILNLALLRPIFSPTDFIQIKGRGTRRHNFTELLFDEDRKATVANPEKATFKLFDFFATCQYFEDDFDYDQILKLPALPKPTPPGPGPVPKPPIGLYEYQGADILATVQEQEVGLEGMKIDRMFFERFENAVKQDETIARGVEDGQWDHVLDYVSREILNKPEDFFTLEKLRRAASVDRRVTLREILEKIFGLIPRFQSRDELLEAEFNKFVADNKPSEAGAMPAIRSFFKAYVTSNYVRDQIDKREFANLATYAGFSLSDLSAVPKRYRTLIPEYVKDYVPLNRFAA
jgi:type I restriction enzyme R subunit